MRVNVDATHVSNIARFMNHACDVGNLEPVLVTRAGCLLPFPVLVARRDIPAGTELTFAYGAPCGAPPVCDKYPHCMACGDKGGSQLNSAHVPMVACECPWLRVRRCLCQTDACLGFMPYGDAGT